MWHVLVCFQSPPPVVDVGMSPPPVNPSSALKTNNPVSTKSEDPSMEFLDPEMANLQKMLATLSTGIFCFIYVYYFVCRSRFGFVTMHYS